MEDGVSVDGSVSSRDNNKMGATGNPNAARLAALQERKKSIEESLAKCTQELKQLCIQEADLTGTIPVEMPLDPGESPPSIRRRIGTAYQLPENLIKNANNKDESATDLELQIQLHANMAEAALGLANEQNISKTLRRQHMADYQQHIHQFNSLQDKLSFLKDAAQKQQQQQTSELQKQKKKPRPLDQDDNISMATTINEPFAKSDLRHSIRSNKTLPAKPEYEPRVPPHYHSRMSFESCYVDTNYRQENALSRDFYRLSINGYKNYLERRENLTNNHVSAPLNLNILHQYQQPKPLLNHYPHPHQPQNQMLPPQKYYYIPNSPSQQQQQNFRFAQHRQSSPDSQSCSNKVFYNPQPSPENLHPHLSVARKYSSERQNYHQIQPHQQYEQMTGLGGYWKPSETGDMVWCHSNNVESAWPRDKRFGSLDRRKNKRLHKRVSPSVDSKSATLASVPSYSEHVRTAAIKSPKVITRRQDARQLVRTQSLGSVGAQTIDSVWPSDDNSSCESDNRSISEQNSRKPKQKEWLETSLDGPVSPTHSIISRSQSALPSVLSPEEKYVATPPPPPKPPLEIPAESNPSPRLQETNIELFNNNIPKNCTVVQAGHCKPYHEETKPFEMSDFYKYSTKYKKSPQKQQAPAPVTSPAVQKNLNESFDRAAVGSPMSPGRLDNTSTLNSSLDLSQLSNANVAERFSDEMNAWYKNKLQIDAAGTSSKGKSTATLV